MEIYFLETDIDLLWKALAFSAKKHTKQRRKDRESSPYINHPIAVAEILWRIGCVRDSKILAAALLHDTVEDTDTTVLEVRTHFGEVVLDLVLEVTDDKGLPKEERKRLQIEHASHLSLGARLIKLGDKISNIKDIISIPPSDWGLPRRREYLNWAEKVVDQLRGTNQGLETYFYQLLGEGVQLLDKEERNRFD